MQQAELPEWEPNLVDEAIRSAQERLAAEDARAKKRALQLAREQGYHRLAAAIDRPRTAGRTHVKGQLRLFPVEDRLFDDEF